MVGADWMKAVGVAICSHVADFLRLGASAAIARSSLGVWILVFVFSSFVLNIFKLVD